MQIQRINNLTLARNNQKTNTSNSVYFGQGGYRTLVRDTYVHLPEFSVLRNEIFNVVDKINNKYAKIQTVKESGLTVGYYGEFAPSIEKTMEDGTKVRIVSSNDNPCSVKVQKPDSAVCKWYNINPRGEVQIHKIKTRVTDPGVWDTLKDEKESLNLQTIIKNVLASVKI